MKATDKIHPTWKPIMGMLYKVPLTTLNYNVLPNVSSQPKTEHIFRAFEMPVHKIKVVILGQDPYPNPGDAIGYAFAINSRREMPASLKIIQQEVEKGDSNHLNGSGEVDLLSWVDQGVLLLNTALTVETGSSGSHLKYWEDFTRRVVNYLGKIQPSIWLLWGQKAQSFKPYIGGERVDVEGYSKSSIKNIPSYRSKNYLISTPHPAAECYNDGNAGFLGSHCFHFVNTILKNNHEKRIIW